MKQKIATIFGASGFIGRHLIRRLTKKDFQIIAALKKLNKSFGNSFSKAIDLIAKCRGKIILAGIGKSGWI